MFCVPHPDCHAFAFLREGLPIGRRRMARNDRAGSDLKKRRPVCISVEAEDNQIQNTIFLVSNSQDYLVTTGQGRLYCARMNKKIFKDYDFHGNK
jgi:hypothetical protein